MAKSSLEQRDNNLATVDYPPLLKDVLSVLKQQASAFHVEKNCLTIDLDEIALMTANKAEKSTLPFTYTFGTTHASVNFEDQVATKKFTKLIEDIKEQLQIHFNTALTQTLLGTTFNDYVESLLTDATAFQGSVARLDYPFNERKDLHKRRLHLLPKKTSGSADDVRLKGHKLTINVKNANDFDHELIESLCNRLEEVCNVSEKKVEVARELLKRRVGDGSSELSILKRVVRTESLGRIQKEAKIRYLEYLSKSIEQWLKNTVQDEQKEDTEKKEGLVYLQNLVQRLRWLEAFINDETKVDAFYQVNYSGCVTNYRDLFARADALDMLPIITEIEGSLGETTDKEKGEQIFITGLKLKLNGHVQSHVSAFDYYLSLLNPHEKTHIEQIADSNTGQQRFAEKVLKIALLYYFVFRNMKDEQYDPRTTVEQELLVDLRSDDRVRETQKLTWLTNGLSKTWSNLGNKSVATYGLERLKKVLEAFVKLPHIGPDLETHALHLNVENGILDDDTDRMQNEKLFLRPEVLENKGMGILKYISIQKADASEDGFCTLPITMTIEPMYYFSPPDEKTRKYQMQYEVNGYQMLPVLLVPNDASIKDASARYYQKYSRIVLHYSSKLPFKHDASETFVYRFTFTLLSYMCVKLLCDIVKKRIIEQRQRLFVPIVRIHKNKKADQENQTNEDSTIRAISKVLSHMIAEEYFSNAQGFHSDVFNILKGGKYHGLANGVSSLYTALPKVFALDTPPILDKVAVILVSSRKSDAHSASSTYIASIYGEVIGIRRNAKGNVRVETLRTFSDYENSSTMYRSPIAIRDQVQQCYIEGYKHILYIAQAPYTSSLNITGTEKDEEQFFMSKEVLQALKDGRSDLNVYPLFCDKYYVVKVGKKSAEAESLYVDDTSELRTLFSDPNRSSIVFFNLFNGFVLPDRSGSMGRTYYNGVVSYATLVNVYDDPIYDQTIRNNLLDGKQIGSLKPDFLDFLTLLHFSRYEKSEKNITFKLEPYQNIIGSASVGTLSYFPQHTISSVRFNALAFLTAVRKALNKQYIGYAPLPENLEQAE